jgi:hypothetical protein
MRDAECGGDSFLLIDAPSIRVDSSTGALAIGVRVAKDADLAGLEGL